MRYVLLDRITELKPPELARGVQCVSLSSDVFEHHFPGYPILPGALILEALAQLAGVLVEQTRREAADEEVQAVLTMVDRARFRRQVRPGDRLILEATDARVTEDGGRVQVRAELDGELATEAQLTFAFTRIDNPRLIERRRDVLSVWLHGTIQ